MRRRRLSEAPLQDAKPSGLLVRHPVVSLCLLVAVSTTVRFLISRGVRNPWVLPDEFIYAELARAIADHGELAIRDVPAHRYPPIYPLLISPAYLIKNPAMAYSVAKALNSFLISLAAVPSYLLARRLLDRSFALVVAVLAVAVPSLGYASEIMTENAFYPIFLAVLLLMIRALEAPTVGRQALVILGLVLAFLTRPQAVALVVAYVTAICLVGLSRQRLGRTLAAFRVTFALLSATLAAAVIAKAAEGHSPKSLLGVYSSAVHSYPLGSIPKWALYHLADLDLYLGVLPFVAALAWLPSLFTRRYRVPSNVAFASVAVAATFWSTLLAATIASEAKAYAPGYPSLPPRVHERYLFYVAPLFFIAFLAWLDSPVRRRARVTAVAIGAAVLAPLLLPYSKLLTNVGSESLALIPWKRVPHTPAVMAATAAVVSTLLLLRGRWALRIQVGFVFLSMVFVGELATNEMRSASAAVPTSFRSDQNWVDDRVGSAPVSVIWRSDAHWSAATLRYRQQAVLNYELFNRSLGRVYYVGQPMQFDLPETRLTVSRGRLVPPAGDLALATSRFALVPTTLTLKATAVGRDPRAGLVLYRLRAGAPIEVQPPP